MTHLFVVFQIFVEAKRTSPSIIYIPSIGQWWETVGPALRATFLSLLSSIPAFAPIFLLATCSFEYRDLSAEVRKKMVHRSHSTTREKFIFDGSGFFSNEWTWFEHFLFWSVFLRFRSCFRRRMVRFSISDPPPAWREETFLRIWSSTRLPKPRRPKRKLVKKKKIMMK